jgi:hypothetical protein
MIVGSHFTKMRRHFMNSEICKKNTKITKTKK